MGRFQNSLFAGWIHSATYKLGQWVDNFVHGFTGSGWGIWRDVDGKYNFEIDNITCRGLMKIFELVIQKIRSIKGAFIISQGNGEIESVREDDVNYYIKTKDEVSFLADDFMRCQQWSQGVRGYWVKVKNIVGEEIVVPKSEFTSMMDAPKVGDEIVQIGNLTNKKRQSCIYMHVDEDGAPAIDVLFNINKKSFDGSMAVRLGKNLPTEDEEYNGLFVKNGLIKSVDDLGKEIYAFRPDGSGQLADGAIKWYLTEDGIWKIDLSNNVMLNWQNLDEDTQKRLTGKGSEQIFILSNTPLDAPLSVDVDNAVPQGWSKYPLGLTSVDKVQYVSIRYKNLGTWGEWSTPVIYSRWAEDGEDGTPGEPGDDGISPKTYILESTAYTIPIQADGTPKIDSFTVSCYMTQGTNTRVSQSGYFSVTRGANTTNLATPSESYTVSVGNGATKVIVKCGSVAGGNDYGELHIYCTSDGSNGEAGLEGMIVRITDWAIGIQYRNDRLTSEPIRFLDIVRFKTTTGSYEYYQCKQTHISTNGMTGYFNSPSFSIAKDSLWQVFSNMPPIYTPILLADYAVIQFGQGNQFLITKSDGTVTAGMSGAGSGANGIRFWAGGVTPALAPFRVDENGKTVVDDLVAKGEVTAEKLVITKNYIRGGNTFDVWDMVSSTFYSASIQLDETAFEYMYLNRSGGSATGYSINILSTNLKAGMVCEFQGIIDYGCTLQVVLPTGFRFIQENGLLATKFIVSGSTVTPSSPNTGALPFCFEISYTGLQITSAGTAYNVFNISKKQFNGTFNYA